MNLTKLDLCLLASLKNSVENDNDPIHNLLSNWKEIKEITKNMNGDIFKFFYFNKKRVHEILYNEDKNYSIDENKTISYSELFYLSLLLEDIPETINYTFSINYIKAVNEIRKDIKIKKLKRILLSKILLLLINNFKGEDEYDEDEYGEEINMIEKENIEYIEKNIDIFETEFNLQYNYSDIISKKIDYIYMEIIISLIENDKFTDYDFCWDIIEQLELDKINITNTIFQGLSNAINKENENAYIINNINDLMNEKTLNFYYILIKYIFKKDSFYIYQLDFLLKNILNLIKLITSKESHIEELKNKKIEELKIILIEEYLIPYNIKKIINTSFESLNNSNEVKNIKEKSLSSRKLSNIKAETNINHNNIIEYDKAEKALEKMKIIIQIYQENSNDRNFEYKEILIGKAQQKLESEDELKIYADYDSITDYDNLDNKIVEKGKYELVYKNYKKLAGFFKDVENSINDSEIKFNPRITLELERELRDINKEGDPHSEYKDLYNMTCNSTFVSQLDGSIMKCIDQNILVNSINGRTPGFIYLINELTNDDYDGEIFKYNEEKTDI
jgi:hypothetical protein